MSVAANSSSKRTRQASNVSCCFSARRLTQTLDIQWKFKPSYLSQWLAFILVLAPAFWVAFGGPSFVHRWHNNAALAIRALVFIVNVALLLAVLWYVVPWVVSFLDGMLYE